MIIIFVIHPGEPNATMNVEGSGFAVRTGRFES